MQKNTMIFKFFVFCLISLATHAAMDMGPTVEDKDQGCQQGKIQDCWELGYLLTLEKREAIWNKHTQNCTKDSKSLSCVVLAGAKAQTVIKEKRDIPGATMLLKNLCDKGNSDTCVLLNDLKRKN